jgi:hypothetical protein
MTPSSKDLKYSTLSTSTQRKHDSDTTRESTEAPRPKTGTFSRFLGSLGIESTNSLHLPSRKGAVVADLIQWGLTPEQADGIAKQPDYLAAHGPALAEASCCIDMTKTPWAPTHRALLAVDQKNLLTVCLAWAAVAPDKACQLINVALPLLTDPALGDGLLVGCANQLIQGIDPTSKADGIGDAIVQLAKAGWAIPNSPGFVPEDVRATLTALASHINPRSGLRVKLEDARLRLESASLDELPDLMAELTQLCAQAMSKSHPDVPRLLLDIRDLADRLARRADTQPLWQAARQLNADAQQWRIQRAEKHMKGWLSIETGHNLQTSAPAVKVTVNTRSSQLQDEKSRASAQKWFREWLRAHLEMPEDIGLPWTALMDVIRSVAGDPPGDAWLGAEHWVDLKLRQARRSGDWTPIVTHLSNARADTIAKESLQQALTQLNECTDPTARADMLKAMLPLLPDPKRAPALHTQYLDGLWRLSSERAQAGSELWTNYLRRHPLSEVDTTGPFAEYVMGVLRDAQTGSAGQGRAAVMMRLLQEFPKPRAGTQWLTWEPACRALLNAAIAQAPDPEVAADLLLRWIPAMAQVPTETRLADIERQFLLLLHVLGRLPMNARTALLKRMDTTLTEQWKLWRENQSAKKEKDLPPFERLALHGAVLAQLQRRASGALSEEELKCPLNRLVAFFTAWSEGLALRAKGQKEAATKLMSSANTTFRYESLDKYGDLPRSANDKYQQLSDEFRAARDRHEY